MYREKIRQKNIKKYLKNMLTNLEQNGIINKYSARDKTY